MKKSYVCFSSARLYTAGVITSAICFGMFVIGAATWAVEARNELHPLFVTPFSWSPNSYTDIRFGFWLEVAHRTHAAEGNYLYPNVRVANVAGMGFVFRVTRQVLYPNWESSGDTKTIVWGPVADWGIMVPAWFCIVVTGILPAHALRGYLRRRRLARERSGLCMYCGYDLRASKERCPECGAEFSKVSSSPEPLDATSASSGVNRE